MDKTNEQSHFNVSGSDKVSELLANNFLRLRMGVGVYDAFTARLANQSRCDFIWLSSYCCSATNGFPDCDLLALDYLEAIAKSVKRASCAPLVLDGGSSLGDVQRVRGLAAVASNSNAAAICIEDYIGHKFSSLYDSVQRRLVPRKQQQTCIAVAVEELRNSNCAVIARPESLVAGLDHSDLLVRSKDAAEAGASAIFVQSKRASLNELYLFLSAWDGQLPVFVAPTLFPDEPHDRLYSLGVTHIIYANHLLRAAHKAMTSVLDDMWLDRGTARLEPHISPISDISSLFPHPEA